MVVLADIKRVAGCTTLTRDIYREANDFNVVRVLELAARRKS